MNFREMNDAEAFDSIFGSMILMQTKEGLLWNLNCVRDFFSGPPKVIVEIGSAHGANLCMLSRLFEDTGLIISVSLEGMPIDLIRQTIHPIELVHLQEDSQLPETFDHLKDLLDGREISLLFIDGDHHYECVKHDYEAYSQLVSTPGVVVVHAIVHEPGSYWKELKESGLHKYAEKISAPDADHVDPPGRGIVFFTDEPVVIASEPESPDLPDPAVIEAMERVTNIPLDPFGMSHVTSVVPEKLPPIYLPFMGEFGSKLYKHCSAVAAAPPPKIICHERGEEPIYPDATERYIFDRPDEDGRGAAGHRDRDEMYAKIRQHYGNDCIYIDPLSIMNAGPRRFFVPEHEHEYDVELDLVLFTRRKAYAAGRNWQAWPNLADALTDLGYRIFLGGQADSSWLLDYPAAWDYENVLDANIWAIKKAVITLGTSTGPQTLAIMCGTSPWLIVSDKGYDSGPSRSGLVFGFYEDTDHLNVGWKLLPHWYDYEWIVKEVDDYMKRHRAGEIVKNKQGCVVRNPDVRTDEDT